MKTKGGKNIYGASVGMLMLETKFPRIPGDIGNANTWPFHMHFEPVTGSSVNKVVRFKAEGTLDEFIKMGKRLIAKGVDAIATNCGFLIIFQEELTEALGVPVFSSALIQHNLIQQTLPKSKVPGILTFSKESLTSEYLEAANIPLDTPVVGMENIGAKEFYTGILEDLDEMDFDLCREEMIEAALKLQADNPNVGAILCECTNMPPYAEDIYKATGLPVYNIYTGVTWFQQSVQPRRFDIKDF